MKEIRRNIFETNSSSVHAIVIKNDGKVVIPNHIQEIIEFEDPELDFGWERAYYTEAREKLAYLYEATVYFTDLRPVLLRYADEIGIHVLTSNVESDWCHIDHADEFGDIYKILKDIDSFKQFVFCPDSFITTGNDNDDMKEKDMTNVYFVLNKYSGLPNYTVYRKGN